MLTSKIQRLLVYHSFIFVTLHFQAWFPHLDKAQVENRVIILGKQSMLVLVPTRSTHKAHSHLKTTPRSNPSIVHPNRVVSDASTSAPSSTLTTFTPDMLASAPPVIATAQLSALSGLVMGSASNLQKLNSSKRHSGLQS